MIYGCPPFKSLPSLGGVGPPKFPSESLLSSQDRTYPLIQGSCPLPVSRICPPSHPHFTPCLINVLRKLYQGIEHGRRVSKPLRK